MIPHTVFGLPLHPLAVHAPVVLIPLVSIGVILIVFVPRWHERYGTLIAIGSVLAFLSAVGAYFSGRNFEDDLEDRGLGGEALEKVEHHASLAQWMPWLALLLAIVTVAFVVLVRRNASKQVVMAIGVVAVIVACGTTAQLARVGDAGARAVFEQGG